MASDDEVEKVQDEIDDLDLGMDKKKKKSKKPKDDDDDAPSKSGGGSGPNEMGPNEFYPYAEILQRVYDAISEKNPELLGAKKFTMIPPQVAREGSKKTVFVNFKDMCKKMHRTMEHVMSYFNAELGVPCSLDPEGKLTFKGRFTPKQIESVVRKYMIAYVQCQMCKNFDSNLVKESATRLTFLECNRCGARMSVQNVEKGFHATNRSDRKAAKAAK
jgi:translation initiation factor 2 subunit 2